MPGIHSFLDSSIYLPSPVWLSLVGVLSRAPGLEVMDSIPGQGTYRRQPTDDVSFILISSFSLSPLSPLTSSLRSIKKILILPSNIHWALLGTVLDTWKQRHPKIYKVAGDMNKLITISFLPKQCSKHSNNLEKVLFAFWDTGQVSRWRKLLILFFIAYDILQQTQTDRD